MDKYRLISLAPCLVIVAAMIVGTFFGARFIKKMMQHDAENAEK